MHYETITCLTCGVTKTHFYPPLVFDVTESCKAVKPIPLEKYAERIGNLFKCHLERGHEGKHIFLVEYLEEWED